MGCNCGGKSRTGNTGGPGAPGRTIYRIRRRDGSYQDYTSKTQAEEKAAALPGAKVETLQR